MIYQLINRVEKIKFQPVQTCDSYFLYELLKERNESINISHSKLPKFMIHVKFIQSHRYKKWYIISYNNRDVGSIYLTKNNEIGIFVKSSSQKKGIGEKAIKKMMDEDSTISYLANINPQNMKSIKLFEKIGYKLIQHTFRYNYK